MYINGGEACAVTTDRRSIFSQSTFKLNYLISNQTQKKRSLLIFGKMLILSVTISQFNIHSVPNNHLCISNILTVQSHLSKAEIPDQFKHQISDASSRPHTSVLLLFTPQVRDLLSPNSSPASGSTHLISLLTDQLHPPSAPVQTNW